MTIQISPQPIAVDADTAAAMLSIGRSTFLARVSRGMMPRPRKIGHRSAWLVEELTEAARNLPVSDSTPDPSTESDE